MIASARAAVHDADARNTSTWAAYTAALDAGEQDDKLDVLRHELGKAALATLSTRDALIKAQDIEIAWLRRELEQREVATICGARAIESPAAVREAFIAELGTGRGAA